jgi:hypothetical protein
MPKNKIGLQFSGLDEMIERLEAAEANIKSATEAALKASKSIVNQGLTKDTTNANFPAGGKYATGALKKSIDKDFNVKWEGTTAGIEIGYDFKKSGMAQIFLMYGTPKMAKVQKIYDDIYGTRTKRKIAEAQKAAMQKVIDRVGG